MRVMLVEDEAALRETLAARLKREGYAVDTAADGEEGLYLGREVPCGVAARSSEDQGWCDKRLVPVSSSLPIVGSCFIVCGLSQVGAQREEAQSAVFIG